MSMFLDYGIRPWDRRSAPFNCAPLSRFYQKYTVLKSNLSTRHSRRNPYARRIYHERPASPSARPVPTCLTHDLPAYRTSSSSYTPGGRIGMMGRLHTFLLQGVVWGSALLHQDQLNKRALLLRFSWCMSSVGFGAGGPERREWREGCCASCAGYGIYGISSDTDRWAVMLTIF
jgi:hypothetical protein